MKKNFNYKSAIIGAILGIFLFNCCYYLYKDNTENNFIIKEDIPKMSEEEAIKIGNNLLKKAVSFYIKTPSKYKTKKEILGEEYYILKPFIEDAHKIMSDDEIEEFIEYYNIKKDKNNYVIKATDNKLTLIYDEYNVKVRNFNEKEIEYKVEWKYCEADKSSNLNECTDTLTKTYTNIMSVVKKNNDYLIDEFDLPKK